MANHWDKRTRSEYRREVRKLAGRSDGHADVEQNTLEGELEAAETRETMKPETKVFAVTDHARAQKHTWMATILNGSHPVTSKGYGENQVFYSLMEPGQEAAGHDLRKLRTEADMTEAEYRFLADTDFGEFEQGKTYEVSE